MSRLITYDKALAKVEKFMKESGIRDFCSTVCPVLTKGHCCCLSCENKGPKGCTLKVRNLFCSLHFCGRLMVCLHGSHGMECQPHQGDVDYSLFKGYRAIQDKWDCKPKTLGPPYGLQPHFKSGDVLRDRFNKVGFTYQDFKVLTKAYATRIKKKLLQGVRDETLPNTMNQAIRYLFPYGVEDVKDIEEYRREISASVNFLCSHGIEVRNHYYEVNYKRS